MNTLKERFKDFLDPEKITRLKFSDGQNEVLSFFHQELLALAEEVEAKTPNPDHTVGGIKFAANVIRSKADELN